MNRQFRFYLKADQSPTHFNLSRYLQEQGWQESPSQELADFSDANLQFNTQAAEQLEYKHLLAQLVDKYCHDVMPLTYCINDENWLQVLNQLASEYYYQNQQLLNQIPNLSWILKPALLNNGKEIKIFQKLSEIERHFLSTKRLGGEHVLQYYLSPHLLRDGRKYSIRMFVVLTNYAGCFIYPNGYYNVALHPFMANDYSDLRSHLTNEHLRDEESNVIQIPSKRFENFPPIYAQIKELSQAAVSALAQKNPQAFIPEKERNFAIYGFDFIVDSSGRLWLLEANHGPCFPVSDDHPLQAYLYSVFWQDFIKGFVQPIAANQSVDSINYLPFERLY
ncbi:Tubulin-tyrosine ligase family protein [Legionella massiliensis]|uniref:Tubulin-tyrosine ligase family protein n=1 Tax=Legionella massiliensis TaxID=1034943 RepID=A0A078KNR2_9GAMM|nr:hypothetical protein [Legionella massiliensis]CDZ75970.1 Tubulin-tyrosine ligase family protein [Legionella massiliensis]CEE11708.1 Tubulin-tyrosine ligase family protein [Legionella massiliensis]